jgi:ribosomal subunit interface protein
MDIAVHAHGLKVGARVRAYVEYRMFSAISRFDRRCACLSVRLEESASARVGTRYRCSVALDLTPAARVRVRATADRLYAAIDQCAERLSRGVEQRLGAGAFEPGYRRGRNSARPSTLPHRRRR